MHRALIFFLPVIAWTATVTLDKSAFQPGPITMESTPESVIVHWPDATARDWRAEFSLNPDQPLITSIGLKGAPVIERAQPIYQCATGKRRGGWDAFFDFPP